MTGHNVPSDCRRPDGGFQCDACHRPIKDLSGLSKHQLSCSIYESYRSRAIAKWGPPPPWSARYEFFLTDLKAIRRGGWPNQEPGKRRRHSASSPGPNGDIGSREREEMRQPPNVSLKRGYDLPTSSGQYRRVPAVNLAANVPTSSQSVSFSTRCPECGKSVEDLSAHLTLHGPQQRVRIDPASQPGTLGPDMDKPKRQPTTSTPIRDRGAAPSSSIDLTDDGPAAKRRKLTPPAAEVEQPPISQPTCPLPLWMLRTNEPRRTAEWLRLYFIPDDTAVMALSTILQVYEEAFAPYKAKYQRLGEPKFRKTFRAAFGDDVLSRQYLGTYSVHGVRARDVLPKRSTAAVPRQDPPLMSDPLDPSPSSNSEDSMERKRQTDPTPVKEVQSHHPAPHSSPALPNATQAVDRPTAPQPPPPRISYLSRSLPDWFLKVDEPKRSAEWLRLCFEPHPVSELGVNSLLQAYYNAFAPVAASHPHLVGPKFFALCRSTFTNVTFGSSPSGTYLIKGIKARATPAGSATLRAQFAPLGEQGAKDKDGNGDEHKPSHTISKPTSVSEALASEVRPYDVSSMSTPTLPGSQRHGEPSASAPQFVRPGTAIVGVPKHRSPWHGACEACRAKGKDHSFCWVSSRLFPGQGGRRVPGSGTPCGSCLKEGIPCVDVLRDGRTPERGARRKRKGGSERGAAAGASLQDPSHIKATPDLKEADFEVDLHYARMIHEKRMSSEVFSQLFRAHGIDPITTLIKWRSLVELGRTNK